MDFNKMLEEYRRTSLSEKDKGTRFERLMQLYLMTEPYYASRFSKVWMWDEFPFRKDFRQSMCLICVEISAQVENYLGKKAVKYSVRAAARR
ncbi:MAG: hypothetical protein LBT50_01875 [Prevotellaceae bacterium]|jgi:predicted helicase|nr:hypothetical protein [Prevotellaceae bacterium]